MHEFQRGYDAAIQNQVRDPHASPMWKSGYDRAVHDTMRSRRPTVVTRHTFNRYAMAMWGKDHKVEIYEETHTVVRLWS